MKVTLGRYRLQIGLAGRKKVAPDNSARELQDHDLAILRDAEREFREEAWVSRSLLSGNGY